VVLDLVVGRGLCPGRQSLEGTGGDILDAAALGADGMVVMIASF